MRIFIHGISTCGLSVSEKKCVVKSDLASSTSSIMVWSGFLVFQDSELLSPASSLHKQWGSLSSQKLIWFSSFQSIVPRILWLALQGSDSLICARTQLSWFKGV